MTKYALFSKSIFLGAALISQSVLLSACSTPSASHPVNHAAQGVLKFNVAWPEFTSTGFQTLAIPEETAEISIEVIDASGNSETQTQIQRSGATSKATLTLSIGQKKITILAKDAQGQTVAESQTQAEIKAGQTTRIESELKPVSPQPSQPPTPNPGIDNPTGPVIIQPSLAPSVQPSSAPAPDTQASPEPVTSPTPVPTPTATPSRTNGGSSGGGGGGGGTTTPTPTTVTMSTTATTNPLSGMGYTTAIKAQLSDNTKTISSISWVCTNADNVACNGFENPNIATTFWTSPADDIAFTTNPVVFTLRATATLNDGTILENNTLNITVTRGTGSVNTDGNSSYDGGF